MAISSDYQLSACTAVDEPIYQQILGYYKFCARIRRMTKATMAMKTLAINDFLRFSGLGNLENITNDMVYDWIADQEARGCVARTINGRLSQLIVMLKWQRDDNVYMPNLKISRIVLQPEMPPRKVFFTREQISKALAMADRREWLMIKIGFDCGLRISELRNIRLSDINGRRIRVVGKGQKLRYAIMSQEARDRLDDYIERNKISDYLWESPKIPGQPIDDHHMRHMMKKPFEAAGFNNFYPHSLRHSYATDLKLLGVPTREIQVGMGHSSETITERYLSDLAGYNIEKLYDVKFSVPDPNLR